MKLNKRERYIVIAVGLVVGIFVLDRFIYTPLSERYELATQRVNDGRLELLDGDGKLRNSVAARRNWKRVTGVKVADNAQAAESQLLNKLREWQQNAGLELNASAPARSDKEKGFEKVTTNRTAAGRMEQIARFLYSVQTSDIPVRINRVSLNTRKDGADDITVNIEIASIYGDVTVQSIAATPAAGGAR
ncbi:MAG TPA: GspMb/PilO family protein [Tepidisphaeraceae bacterium]|jgi:hypothetical protein